MSRYVAWDNRLAGRPQTHHGAPVHSYGRGTPLNQLASSVEGFYNRVHTRVELDIWCHGTEICTEGLTPTTYTLLDALSDKLMMVILRGCGAADLVPCEFLARRLRTCVIASTSVQLGTTMVYDDGSVASYSDPVWEGFVTIFKPDGSAFGIRRGRHSVVRRNAINFMSHYPRMPTLL